MKKRILTILTCLLMLINVFALSACTNIEGTFYSLEEAYKMGLLAKDDLLSIAYYHNGGREGNEELMPEDYVPQPQDFEALSEKVKDNICKAYLNYLNDPYYNKVIFLYYHGVYNGYTVVELLETNSGVLVDPLFLETYELDGIWFEFFNPDYVKLWVEEK